LFWAEVQDILQIFDFLGKENCSNIISQGGDDVAWNQAHTCENTCGNSNNTEIQWFIIYR
jgi:hypothetical protein